MVVGLPLPPYCLILVIFFQFILAIIDSCLAMCGKVSLLGFMECSGALFSLLHSWWFSEKEERQRPRVIHWRYIWYSFCREQIWNRRKSDSRTICIWYVNSRYILIYMYNLATKKRKKKHSRELSKHEYPPQAKGWAHGGVCEWHCVAAHLSTQMCTNSKLLLG